MFGPKTQSSLFLQAFALLLQAPRDDADATIKERFPVPRLVICDQHGSQVCTSLLVIQSSVTCLYFFLFSFLFFLIFKFSLGIKFKGTPSFSCLLPS